MTEVMRVLSTVLLASVCFVACASSTPGGGGGGYYPGYRPPQQQRGYPQQQHQQQQPQYGNHPLHQYGGQPQQQQGVYSGQQQQQEHGLAKDEVIDENTPSTSPRLPEPWQEHKDPSSGKFYYYNPSNGVTQWNRPVDDATAASAVAEEEEISNQDIVDPVESLHVELLLASKEAVDSALNFNSATTAGDMMFNVEDVNPLVSSQGEKEKELKMVNDKESIVDDETDRLYIGIQQNEVGETIAEEKEKGEQQIEGTIGTTTNQVGEQQYYRQEHFQPGNMQQRGPGPTGQWNSGWQPQGGTPQQQSQQPPFQGGKKEGGDVIETLGYESQSQSPSPRQQQQQQQPSQPQQMQHQWQQPPSQQKQQISPQQQQQPRQSPGAGYGLTPPGWKMRQQPQHPQQMLPGQPLWDQPPPLQSQQQSQQQQQQQSSIPSKPAFSTSPPQQQQQQFPPAPYHQGFSGCAGPPRYPGQQQQQQYPPPHQGYYDPYYGTGQVQPQGPGAGQLVQQRTEELSKVVRERWGQALGGLSLFGNRTAALAENAANQIGESATSATRAIGETSTGLWGRFRSGVDHVKGSIFERNDPNSQGYSLSQYGVPPPMQQRGQQQYRPGYPPQQQYGGPRGYHPPGYPPPQQQQRQQQQQPGASGGFMPRPGYLPPYPPGIGPNNSPPLQQHNHQQQQQGSATGQAPPIQSQWGGAPPSQGQHRFPGQPLGQGQQQQQQGQMRPGRPPFSQYPGQYRPQPGLPGQSQQQQQQQQQSSGSQNPAEHPGWSQ